MTVFHSDFTFQSDFISSTLSLKVFETRLKSLWNAVRFVRGHIWQSSQAECSCKRGSGIMTIEGAVKVKA